MAGRTNRFWALLSCGLATFVLGAATGPVQASPKPVRCGPITVEGKGYKISAKQVGCEFALRWSRHFLARGHRPDGWTCTRYTAQESQIAFSCRMGSSVYYAVRK